LSQGAGGHHHELKFHLGDRVRKRDCDEHRGISVSVFITDDGAVRYVVEAPLFRGSFKSIAEDDFAGCRIPGDSLTV
jgi:hypothetical protein